MGQPWVDHPSWEVVTEASDISGRDLGFLLLRAEQAELTQTANAQLATFVLCSVILDAVERVGLAPTLCAGHSLGEYTALAAAGALDFEDGVRLVGERGAAMHAAGEEQPGTMAAVLGADDEVVEEVCRQAGGQVWVANYNAPGQVVIAGAHEAVERAGALAKEHGARRVMAVPVAGAFHTALMATARERLRKALSATRFLHPDVPVVANVDARPHPMASEWPRLLSAQLCSPVRWRQSLTTLAELGATVVAEIGPGGVLTGLAKRTLPDVRTVSVATPADLDELVDAAAGAHRWHSYAESHEGERLWGTDRVVVSPTAGEFQPLAQLLPAVPGPGALATAPSDAPVVVVGEPVGQVAGTEVLSPFAGRLVGFLAHPGERVAVGQPLAWLHTQPEGPGAGAAGPA